MAHSASFIRNNELYENENCFSGFTGYEGKNQYIVIEEDKLYFPKNKARLFLNDLKKIGFKFTYRFDKKNKRFLINTDQVFGKKKRILLCMCIRFLWEGTYKITSYGQDYDLFIEIVNHYFNIKDIFNKKFNVLERLCIAMNAFICGKYSYNSNHTLSYKSGCKIKSNLDDIESQMVNSFFSINNGENWDKNNFENDYPKESKSWTIKNYNSLLKTFNITK